ncbi:gluconate 2-dehydrogenase subunit 3 family protein [Temperatibacter marinus]|uniref:Gluconate 2-dehydrogenase subunit 3 family protein n=1 Tax=Temperatibacter marinus TaxID=1456591 RepID=A0AA52EEV3_9PROT|nr:gluconate 2-dehydrogenase subunit 3 family protein [Temperatibacter marinus]WND01803.1 gluconate 2-dehydrogenase subunit 3 family protein [Temperatibacter marinus]
MTAFRKDIDRRTSMKWMASMAATVLSASAGTYETLAADAYGEESSTWPALTLKRITGPGYGTDPDLVSPKTPWPLTLSTEEKLLLTRLSDLICPEDSGGPSASHVGVVSVIDEWVSAPYRSQQNDRMLVIPGLQWVNEEAQRRSGRSFLDSSNKQQEAILDAIAYADKGFGEELKMPKRFFSKLRQLVFGAYFSSPEGMKDIGYMGNVPIEGPWPGPTREALEHLNTVLENLGYKPEPIPLVQE